MLRRIRSVRRSLTRDALITLIRALVISKVDYCNSVLAGISGMLISRLQSVLNAAARLIFAARKSDRITPLLEELHWLKVPERIRFRLCVLAYRCLRGTAPAYLADSLQLASMLVGRRCLRSAEAIHGVTCSCYSLQNSWRQYLSCGGCSCLEHYTVIYQTDVITLCVSPTS